MTPSLKDILANGRVCCLLNLSCCIPPNQGAQLQARAEVVYAFSGMPPVEKLPDWAWECAKNLGEHFDFVPVGCGAHAVAIAEAYAANLKKTATVRGKAASGRHDGGAAVV